MNKSPVTTIKGPAYLVYGTTTILSQSDITLSEIINYEDISTSLTGVVGKKVKDRKIEVKFTPVEFTNLTMLFPFIGKYVGESIFPSTDTALKIYSNAGNSTTNIITLPKAAITGISSLTLGSASSPLGEFTFTCLPKNADLSDITNLIKEETASSAFTPPSLTKANLLSLPFFGVIGDVAFDFEDGATIDITMSAKEDATARTGIFDYTLENVEASAKFKMKNISESDFKTLTNLFSSSAGIGAIYGISENDLIIRGKNEGDSLFTLKSVSPVSDKTLTFSRSENRFSEITFTAFGSGGENKFAISTCSADFTFDDDETDEVI